MILRFEVRQIILKSFMYERDMFGLDIRSDLSLMEVKKYVIDKVDPRRTQFS